MFTQIQFVSVPLFDSGIVSYKIARAKRKRQDHESEKEDIFFQGIGARVDCQSCLMSCCNTSSNKRKVSFRNEMIMWWGWRKRLLLLKRGCILNKAYNWQALPNSPSSFLSDLFPSSLNLLLSFSPFPWIRLYFSFSKVRVVFNHLRTITSKKIPGTQKRGIYSLCRNASFAYLCLERELLLQKRKVISLTMDFNYTISSSNSPHHFSNSKVSESSATHPLDVPQKVRMNHPRWGE